MPFKWRPSRALRCVLMGTAGGVGFAVMVAVGGPPWFGWEYFLVDVLFYSLGRSSGGLASGRAVVFPRLT